jgi:hypothetical protein
LEKIFESLGSKQLPRNAMQWRDHEEAEGIIEETKVEMFVMPQ